MNVVNTENYQLLLIQRSTNVSNIQHHYRQPMLVICSHSCYTYRLQRTIQSLLEPPTTLPTPEPHVLLQVLQKVNHITATNWLHRQTNSPQRTLTEHREWCGRIEQCHMHPRKAAIEYTLWTQRTVRWDRTVLHRQAKRTVCRQCT